MAGNLDDDGANSRQMIAVLQLESFCVPSAVVLTSLCTDQVTLYGWILLG